MLIKIKKLKAKLSMLLKNINSFFKGYKPYYINHTPDYTTYRNLWSSFDTPIINRPELGKYNACRIQNMELAISKLNNLIIHPQEIFQFWRLIPYPNRKNGFYKGPSIINGKIKIGYGGGLCQISSTLFNIFMQANFEILERKNHSIDPHGDKRFISLGLDAAVAYGYKDLVVRNQNKVPLKLQITLNKNDATVTAKISAQTERQFIIKTESDILEEIPALIPKGKSGWKVKTKRYISNVNSNLSPWYKNYECIDVYQPHKE